MGGNHRAEDELAIGGKEARDRLASMHRLARLEVHVADDPVAIRDEAAFVEPRPSAIDGDARLRRAGLERGAGRVGEP